uniref:Uncharacterized protein n=1 Tax=Panagrolaimus davidi TaxID=227884 RepID=A0A914QHJ6_9BILA
MKEQNTDDLKSKYEDDLETPESNFTTTILPSKLRKLQLLSVKVDNDNSGIRYRKSRNKIGGNERDHWKEENLIHMVCIFTAVKLNWDLRETMDVDNCS